MELAQAARKVCVWLAAVCIGATLHAQDAGVVSSERVVVTAPELASTDSTTLEAQTNSGNALLESLSRRAPNFLLNEAGASSFNDVYAVRGLGNTPNFSKQAVVLYVDDVPSSSTFTNFTDLLTPSTLELRRGPQGDYFGKNAEAGVINIRTFAPSNQPQLFSALTFGDYDARSLNVSAGGAPLRDKLFIKLDLLAAHRDGYLRNEFRDTRPDYQNHFAGRFVARLVPSAQWEITASVELHNNRDGVQRFVPLSGDPFEVAFDFDGRTRFQGDIEALRIARTFGTVRLTAISSRRDWRLSPYEADFDYSPEPIVRGRFQLRQTQLAQELRLEPSEAGGEYTWRVGIFGARIHTSGDELYALSDFQKRITFDDYEHNAAIFAQLTRRFGRLELLGGMRIDFTEDEIERERRESFSPAGVLQARREEWNAQPKLAARYRLSDEAEAYVRSSYGYKNGGFSFLESDPRLASYDPERVWSNEAGFRAALAEKRVHASGALFYNSVWDYQVERLSLPPDITVVNAPRVAIWGGELAVSAKPTEPLELRGSFGYTHSEFTRFRDPLGEQDYAGNSVPFAPEFTAAFGASYRDRNGLFAEAEILAAGKTFYDEANTPFLRQAPHLEVNAKLGYERKSFRAYIFCDNATDTRYFSQKIGYARIGTPGAPRSVGAVLTLEL